MENSNNFIDSIKDKIYLYFDNALNESDRQELMKAIDNNPACGELFKKEKNFREQIKSQVKRPEATPDFIQQIKNRIKDY